MNHWRLVTCFLFLLIGLQFAPTRELADEFLSELSSLLRQEGWTADEVDRWVVETQAIDRSAFENADPRARTLRRSGPSADTPFPVTDRFPRNRLGVSRRDRYRW